MRMFLVFFQVVTESPKEDSLTQCHFSQVAVL